MVGWPLTPAPRRSQRSSATLRSSTPSRPLAIEGRFAEKSSTVAAGARSPNRWELVGRRSHVRSLVTDPVRPLHRGRYVTETVPRSKMSVIPRAMVLLIAVSRIGRTESPSNRAAYHGNAAVVKRRCRRIDRERRTRQVTRQIDVVNEDIKEVVEPRGQRRASSRPIGQSSVPSGRGSAVMTPA